MDRLAERLCGNSLTAAAICRRNVELTGLTGRLAPDFKAIADLRRGSGTGIRDVRRPFVVLCRELKLFSQATVAIKGCKFEADNSRERNYTAGKLDRRPRERRMSSATSTRWTARRLTVPRS
jgi:hypothetical protein